MKDEGRNPTWKTRERSIHGSARNSSPRLLNTGGKPGNQIEAEPAIGNGGIYRWRRRARFRNVLPKKRFTRNMRRKAAKRATFEYIEAFYNRKRLHSRLHHLSPVE